MSLSNIALVNGKLGRRGCGVNPIRGQNNVQGACDMGAMPGDLTGYQKVANPEARAKFEAAWGVEISPVTGLRSTEVLPAAAEGRIKGLFICGEDPVRSDPDTTHVIHALESLEFLVVDELFLTETARYADVVLPGYSYAEKEGTFTNTERRVQRVRKAVAGPEGAKPDTEIFTEIMNRMGYAQPHSERRRDHGRDRIAHALLRRHQPRAPRQRRGGGPRTAMALPHPPSIRARPSCTWEPSPAARRSTRPPITDPPPRRPTRATRF